jgi:hypothetical protein
MPRLDNTRHEIFAKGLVSGKTAIDAYKAAGYKPNRSCASRLATNANLLSRVNELRADMAEREKLDRAWIITRLMRNAEKENGAVSNRALELLGKVMGIFKEIEGPSQSELQAPPPQAAAPASDSEVIEFFKAATKQYGG